MKARVVNVRVSTGRVLCRTVFRPMGRNSCPRGIWSAKMTSTFFVLETIGPPRGLEECQSLDRFPANQFSPA